MKSAIFARIVRFGKFRCGVRMDIKHACQKVLMTALHKAPDEASE